MEGAEPVRIPPRFRGGWQGYARPWRSGGPGGVSFSLPSFGEGGRDTQDLGVSAGPGGVYFSLFVILYCLFAIRHSRSSLLAIRVLPASRLLKPAGCARPASALPAPL